MTPTDIFTIGELAREVDCKVQTIRYYEQIGLMPKPARTNGNQRQYGSAALRRLEFIRHGRQLGFSLDAIRDLLSLCDQPDCPCNRADAIARNHLAKIESRIAQLQRLKREIKRMVAQCGGGRGSDCRVISGMANHSNCLHEHHPPAQANELRNWANGQNRHPTC